MNEADRRKLNTNLTTLIRDLDTLPIAEALLAANLFTDHHIEKIKSKDTKADRNRELIDILKTRGPRAFTVFVDALRAAGDGQEHLLQLLTNETTTADSNLSSRISAAQQVPLSQEITMERLRNVTDTSARLCLTKSMAKICEVLLVRQVAVELESRGALTRINRNSILAHADAYDKNLALVDFLLLKTKKEFLDFVDALIATGQESIVTVMAQNIS